MTSLPRWAWTASATWLPIVPLGTKRPASKPARSATMRLEPRHGGVLGVDVVADLG
jgi:hypothetical protein